MADKRRNGGRGVVLLLLVAAVPCLLCSGMAALIGGRDFGTTTLAIILALYCVVIVVGYVTWIALGGPRRGPDSRPDDGRDGDAP
jgi:cation transporter-like permease